MSATDVALVATIVAAGAITWLGVGAMRRWAARHGVVDTPNPRSSHVGATPRGGGLAIVAVTVAGVLVAWGLALPDVSTPVVGPLAGALLVAAVSWLDDLRSLATATRLCAHTAAAIVAVASIGPWQTVAVPPFGIVDLGWAGWPLTVLWVVGLTNAYNFMDGIDGIAAWQAIVAGLGWVALASIDGPAVALCGALLAASSAGFLVHNWPPARIFMGDVGSAFLGYAFAILTVMAAQVEPLEALAGALLVWPFVFDTAFTFCRRLGRGDNVFAAHRSHLYQRLVRTGLTHGTVSALYVGLALVGVVLAVGLQSRLPVVAVAWPVVIGGAVLGLWAFTRHRERAGPGPRSGRSRGD